MTVLDNETPDMEEFMKKKEKYCSAKIKTLESAGKRWKAPKSA